MTDNAHYRPPTNRSDHVFNGLVRWLADHGVNVAGAQTLTVVGRKTGALQRIPVNPLTLDGHEYLVSPRGNTQWVRNARAAGGVELTRGRRHRTVRLVELDPAQRMPMLRAYLAKWGWEVGRLLPEGLTPDADDETLAQHAAALPVFEIVS